MTSSRLVNFLSWVVVSFVLMIGAWVVYRFAAPVQAKADLEKSIPPTPNTIVYGRRIDLPAFSPSTKLSSIIRLADLHTYRPPQPRFSVTQHTVEKGDTAWTIAKKHNIQPETILWSNEGLSTNAGSLRVGVMLNILPVDGVLHTVREGDTLERIQALYGVSIDEIVNFIGNNFRGAMPDKLLAESQIIVPGGKKQIVWQEPGPTVLPGKGRKSPGYYSGHLVYIGSGYFSWPISPIVITQPYWSGHLGIDVGTYERQPIFASDSGTVIFSGWDTTGFGNLVIIDHGNGYWSYYGHNYANLVREGQGVVKGQQIAESGSTGNSSGNHIDFRIRLDAGGFLNPADFLP